MTPLDMFSGKAWAIAIQPVRETTEKKKVTTKPRRVVVTGMGVVSCLGHDPDSFYNNLLDGKSGITEIENFDCKDFPTVSFGCFLFDTLSNVCLHLI